MTLTYAAALGAEETRYLDDLAPDHLIAPPPFCVVPEWPVVTGPAFRGALGITAEERWGGIHVLQDSHFHGVIIPGETVVTQGTIIQIRPTSAGAFVATKLKTVKQATGEPVVTTWHGSIFVRMAVEGDARSAEAPPPLRATADLDGRSVSTQTILIPRTLPHIYTECGNIWNPIHTERAAARAKGLPDIILHGTATWALAALQIIRDCAGGDSVRLRRFGARFKGMVIPACEIALEHRRSETKPGEIKFVVRNAAGELALSHGIAEISS